MTAANLLLSGSRHAYGGQFIFPDAIRLEFSAPADELLFMHQCKVCWYGQHYIADTERNQLLEKVVLAFDAGMDEQLLAAIQVLQAQSGEFACWVYKENQVLFFNDLYGRLPVYLFEDAAQDVFFLGRNIEVLKQHVTLSPNQTGIAQTLWAGYAIGLNSVFNNLQVVPPGISYLINTQEKKYQKLSGTPIDFSERNAKPIKDLAHQLAEKFTFICRQMVASTNQHWHLSLSGGQDARAVLAGFAKATPHLSASSFTMGKGFADAIIAEQLAAQYCVPWQAISISPSIDDDWLIDAKAGFNYAGMAFIKPYLEQVAAAYPQHIMLTGDGGDKLLPYLGEPTPPTSLDALVETILIRHAIVPAALAAKAAGLHRDELAQSVYQCVAAYPEHSINDRSIHFVLTERARRAYFEGEDRNRLFMWSTTPFYHPEFVQMAMQVPDDYKKRYRFYHAFMQELDASLQTIPDANGHRLGSTGFAAHKWMQEQFRSGPVWLKNMLRQLNTVRRGNNTAASKLKIDLPSSLSFMPDNAVQQVWQTSEEAAWHLRTIAKVFR